MQLRIPPELRQITTGPNAGTNSRGVTWGIDVVRNVVPRYIYRFDCSMKVSEDG